MNEVKGGKTRYIFRDANLTTWSNHWQRGIGVTTGSPRITFTGFTIPGTASFRGTVRKTSGWSAMTSRSPTMRAAATT